jgi:hypothetical protein
LNTSHGFGLQWLLQLCIFYQANKLLKLAKGVGQEQRQKQWGQKDWRVLTASKQWIIIQKNGQDPTRDHLKNTLIENLS